MRRRRTGSLFLAASLSCGVASAELTTRPATEDNPLQASVVKERRNGVVLGFAGGVGAAGSSGYPNDVKFVGNDAYYSSSPLLVGPSMTFFVMGALTDFLNIGPFLNIATFESEQWKSTGAGGGLRGELFPLLHVVPTLADLSVYGQLGFGSTTLRAKGPYPTADATSSFLGLGVHYEMRLGRFLGGHAAAGPFLEYDVIRSSSAERHWLSGGIRLAWYTGGVALDQRD